MTIEDAHSQRIRRLLINDAERRNHIRGYMKKYRAKAKEETGKEQKQYYTNEDIKIRQRASYKTKRAINDIKFLFQE